MNKETVRKWLTLVVCSMALMQVASPALASPALAGAPIQAVTIGGTTMPTPTPIPTVRADKSIQVNGNVIKTTVQILKKSPNEGAETILVPLSFFERAFGMKRKGNVLTKGNVSIRLSEDLNWFKYTGSSVVRTIPVQTVTIAKEPYIPMRKVLETMEYKIASSGNPIIVYKPTPTPKPTSQVTTTPKPTSTTATPNASSGTPTATPTATLDPECSVEVARLKAENKLLKDQLNQLKLQIQTLQTQSFGNFSF